jgi:hypothetical protein
VFDENSFPMSQQPTPTHLTDFDFLTDDIDPLPSTPLFPTGTSVGVPARQCAVPPVGTPLAPRTECPRVASNAGAAVKITAATPTPAKVPSPISGAR